LSYVAGWIITFAMVYLLLVFILNHQHTSFILILVPELPKRQLV
jgi:hypothetical protein